MQTQTEFTIETLRSALDYRQKEVWQHQINIDNFRLAIDKIERDHCGKAHMELYADRMRDLLGEALREQEKEMVMLEVIRAQLEKLECTR